MNYYTDGDYIDLLGKKIGVIIDASIRLDRTFPLVGELINFDRFFIFLYDQAIGFDPEVIKIPREIVKVIKIVGAKREDYLHQSLVCETK